MQVLELSLVYARSITLSKTFAGHTSEFAVLVWLSSVLKSMITMTSRLNDPYWHFPVIATIKAWSTASRTKRIKRTKSSSQILAFVGMTLPDWMTPRNRRSTSSLARLFPSHSSTVEGDRDGGSSRNWKANAGQSCRKRMQNPVLQCVGVDPHIQTSITARYCSKWPNSTLWARSSLTKLTPCVLNVAGSDS